MAYMLKFALGKQKINLTISDKILENLNLKFYVNYLK